MNVPSQPVDGPAYQGKTGGTMCPTCKHVSEDDHNDDEHHENNDDDIDDDDD